MALTPCRAPPLGTDVVDALGKANGAANCKRRHDSGGRTQLSERCFRRLSPLLDFAGPTGTGRQRGGEHCLGLADLLSQTGHEDVDAASCHRGARAGGRVRVALKGKQNGEENCLHPDKIEWLAEKGWNYRTAFALENRFERQAPPANAPPCFH